MSQGGAAGGLSIACVTDEQTTAVKAAAAEANKQVVEAMAAAASETHTPDGGADRMAMLPVVPRTPTVMLLNAEGRPVAGKMAVCIH